METFQMEIDKESKKAMFRTNGGSYWTLVTHGEIQSTATEVEVNTMFDIEWRGQRWHSKQVMESMFVQRRMGSSQQSATQWVMMNYS
ncbi:fascin-2-like [Etheostoma spectabile]|uniref:fascin-2-like n=1 Tax=Etheostoma spectabile TaxID=54343 RepID=UPI0013AEE7E1|nr:fascin-2-like [Etheostoma spectabile]